MVAVAQLNEFIKTHQTRNLKLMNFIICKLNLNKAIFKKHICLMCLFPELEVFKKFLG